MTFWHEKEFEVRDYECDMADGVNNAVYLNYFEHARHCMLKEAEIDFAELARQKIGLVVKRIEVDFVRPLMSGDKFVIKTTVRRLSRLRFEFNQQIQKIPDGTIVAEAKLVGVPINEAGKPFMEPQLELKVNQLITKFTFEQDSRDRAL